MLKLDYISARGDILPLANNPLFIPQIDGQTTASTSVSSASVSGVDGDSVNNIQAVARTLVIDLHIRSGVDVEKAKRAILKIIKLKQRGRLEWTQAERTVTLAGVVEEIDLPRWTDNPIMQVTLHCEQPFWEDVTAVVQQISEAINLHYFTRGPVGMLYFPETGVPFGAYDTIRTKSFYNDGDVDVGLEITILAHDIVTNPIIYDGDGNYFGLNMTLAAGDNVVITTHKGRKTVKYNGVAVYDKIKQNSTWLQLAAGDNQYSIGSDDDSITNMSFSLIYKQRYI